MPYIKQEQRAQVDAQIKELANSILKILLVMIKLNVLVF